MGLFDWMMRRLRGLPAEEPDAPTEAPAPTPGEAGAERPDAAPRQKKAKAERRKKPRAERPQVPSSAEPGKQAGGKTAEASRGKASAGKAARASGGKAAKAARGKAARGKAAKAAKAARETASPAADPRAEVLTVEEAERRYGGLVQEKPLPKAGDEPTPDVEVAAPEERRSDRDDDRSDRDDDRWSDRDDRRPGPREDDPAAVARRAEAKEHRRRAAVPRFEGLLSRARALLAVEAVDAQHLRAARQQLLADWRGLGAPPDCDAERLNAARDDVLAALDARYDAAYAVLDAERRENLARKLAIVAEAQALAERAELKGAGPEMGALRAKLRAVGPVPREEAPAVDEAFAAAEARLKERQAQLRASRDEERAEGLQRLERVVEQAEALLRSPDPEGAAERAKGLQASWKAIRVPGARAETDVLWARFRTACDAVFARRTEARIEAAGVTLARLESIVVRAEGLAETGVDGDPEDVIHKLITEWKRVGRAPREARDALWDRLGRAFDRLRSPPVELPQGQDEGLQFRPFAALSNAEDEADDAAQGSEDDQG